MSFLPLNGFDDISSYENCKLENGQYKETWNHGDNFVCIFVNKPYYVVLIFERYGSDVSAKDCSLMTIMTSKFSASLSFSKMKITNTLRKRNMTVYYSGKVLLNVKKSNRVLFDSFGLLEHEPCETTFDFKNPYGGDKCTSDKQYNEIKQVLFIERDEYVSLKLLEKLFKTTGIPYISNIKEFFDGTLPYAECIYLLLQREV